MNYRHHYHAGNFADVVKHAVLARVLTYMKLKPAPFRVIDTHAGAGRYDLLGAEAEKTSEWRDGVGRIMDVQFDADVEELLGPYRAAIRAVNEAGELRHYPGSPCIARYLMRSDDVLVANELRVDDFASLRDALRRSKATTVLNLDAWVAVKSLLPPKERRGVVLIDPPFERRDEFLAMAEAAEAALSRFANGIYLFWFPIKPGSGASDFISRLSQRPDQKFLEISFAVQASAPGLGLTEMGLLVLNPPHVLRGELERMLPAIADVLSEGSGSGFRMRSSEN